MSASHLTYQAVFSDRKSFDAAANAVKNCTGSEEYYGDYPKITGRIQFSSYSSALTELVTQLENSSSSSAFSIDHDMVGETESYGSIDGVRVTYAAASNYCSENPKPAVHKGLSKMMKALQGRWLSEDNLWVFDKNMFSTSATNDSLTIYELSGDYSISDKKVRMYDREDREYHDCYLLTLNFHQVNAYTPKTLYVGCLFDGKNKLNIALNSLGNIKDFHPAGLSIDEPLPTYDCGDEGNLRRV
jgi:hypothetical protein